MSPALNWASRNIHGLLKVFQILLRELQRGFRQQNADELLSHVESKSAFGIGTWARVTAV